MYEEISRDELIELLSNKPTNCFYKGVKKKYNTSDFFYINTELHDRKSKERLTNYHFYDLAFNNLASWRNFPKRNKSIIGTTSASTAKAYTEGGNEMRSGIYLVVPLEKPTICVCPKYDLLYSFSKLDAHYKSGQNAIPIQFNLAIADYLIEKKQMSIESIHQLDYLDFIEVCDEIKESGISSDPILKDLIKSEFSSEEFLSNLFDPVFHGFELKNNDLSISENGKGKEVFASGQFVLISIENQNILYSI